MQSLNEKTWKPIPMTALFQKFVRGKVSSASDELKRSDGIPYVGATDRNNGVLDYLEADRAKIQPGNCITFIRDGQGSVGSSIYRATPCIATVNTSSGYASWLNQNTGLFVSTSSNQVRGKYGFGYKRKEKRLFAERIMLPVTDSGEPDYEYMAEYVQQKRDAMFAKYRAYVETRIAELGEYVEIPKLDEKEWKPIYISDIFEFVRGRENNMAMLEDGDVPLISAKANNNGLKGFVHSPKKVIAGRCITLNNDGDGGAGLAYYQPANMALDTHVTALMPRFDMSMFAMLFIAECISGLHGFFGHGLSISNPRAKRIRIMLPVTDSGEPDYEYMEQYAKNMMLRKYRQYLAYLDRQKQWQE